MLQEYEGYIYRRVVKETEKAYLVEVNVNNRTGSCLTKFKWVAKSICKPSVTIEGLNDKYAPVPETAICNGIW